MTDRRRFLGGLAATTTWALLPHSLHASAHGSADDATTPVAPAWPVPPQTPRHPETVGRFGARRTDDYAWLRPDDWHAVLRDPLSLDADIRTEVDAENAYLATMLAPAQPLREALAARIAAREPLAQAELPVRQGGHLYRVRHPVGAEHPQYLRHPLTGGPEQVLLDPAVESGDSTYYNLHWNGPSRSQDDRLIGWAEDRTGSGRFRLRVREIDSGRMRVDAIEDAHGGFAFSPDGRHLYWVARNDIGRAAEVRRRDLDTGEDVAIYVEPIPALYISLRTTASGRYVVIRIYDGDHAEVRLVPMDAPTAAPILVEARTPGLDYDVDDWNDRLVIRTNADGADDFQLMTADPGAPGRAHWRAWVPHRPGHLITALHPFADALVREEWHDANPRLVLMRPDGQETPVDVDLPAYTLRVPVQQPWQAASLVFGLQSPALPEQVCTLALDDGTVARTTPDIAADFPTDAYRVQRLQARAADGETVPITLLTRRDAAVDTQAPLLLYAYGSYGASVEPRFDPAALALVDEGWHYAIAHVRGGSEKGTHWWRQVLREGKPTTFTDFIACAEHLIATGHTAPRRIVARGMSAGGLLAGAVYAQRPDLWAGAIAEVAFVDVLNTMEQFDTHPLGTGALPIWGDPRIPAQHASMAAWSPYERLRPADYPALLATGAVADERVGFYEPLKFAARARALTTGHRPIMAHIELDGGHGGASGASAARTQEARLLAFAIWAADDRWGAVPQRPGDAGAGSGAAG